VRIFILFIRIFDSVSNRIITLLFRLQQLLTGLLPALAPPLELTQLIQTHYAHTYRNASSNYPEHSPIWTLEPWEEEVLARHMNGSGTVLVLGTGVGRESIAIAQKGYGVLGLDIHLDALRWAQQRAKAKGTQVWFVQASFLAIPAIPACVDYILLPSVMYSAIPGRQERQSWLRSVRTYLKPQGRAILNFMVVREPETTTQRLTLFLARRLMKLPGANKSYQPGDTCAQGHFLHLFATEAEIRSELTETGVTILALNWPSGFAVVSWLPSG
jgi:ubiquinone/menaquinone biosynthesis C-methylase UbiE